MGISDVNNDTEEKRPYLRGVKLLVDGGINVVPDIYVKPKNQRLSLASLESLSGHVLDIPVIDISGLHGERDKKDFTIKAIAKACEQWGFFQVINHGVGSSTIEDMKRVAWQFFDLPVEEKMKYHSTSLSASQTMYSTSFNPYKEKVFDWRDYLRHSCYPLSRDVLDTWPSNPAKYRDSAANYSQAVTSLSTTLLCAISEGLGLDNTCFTRIFENSEQFILLNYYPPCPDPELAMGLSNHSDVGGITVLLQDTVPGLQVMHDNQWVPVKPIPGAFVINIGDQLQVLSNGRYKSVEHRVVLNRETPRLSIAMFHSPCLYTTISPIKELLNEHKPALYKSFKFRDYKQCFYSKLDGKTCIKKFQA